MNWVTFFGVAASICTATASLPQLVRIWRKRKAEDISLAMLLVLIAGLGLWVYYGILIEDRIVMVANAFPFLVNTAIAVLTVRFRKKGSSGSGG